MPYNVYSMKRRSLLAICVQYRRCKLARCVRRVQTELADIRLVRG